MSSRFEGLWDAYLNGTENEYNAEHAPMKVDGEKALTLITGLRQGLLVAGPFCIVLAIFGLALMEVPTAEYFVEILSPAWEVQ